MWNTWNPTPPYFHVLSCVECKPWLDILTHFRGFQDSPNQRGPFLGSIRLYEKVLNSPTAPLPKLPPWWFINLANHVDMQNPSKCLQSTCIHFNYCNWRMPDLWRPTASGYQQEALAIPSRFFPLYFFPFVQGANFAFKDCPVGSVCATAPQLAIRFFRNLTVMKNHPDQMTLRCSLEWTKFSSRCLGWP